MSGDVDIDCTCGHEMEDHLWRLAIPHSRYGACTMHGCECDEYEEDES